MAKSRGPVRRTVKKFLKIDKLFSRFIIVICLSYMVHVTERVLDIAEYQGLNCYNILAAAGAVFGGELLLLAFKYIASEKFEGAANAAKVSIGEVINKDIDCD